MIPETGAEVEARLPAFAILWEARPWRHLEFLCQCLAEVSGSSQLFHGCPESGRRAFILLMRIIAGPAVVLGLTIPMASELSQFADHGHFQVMSRSGLW